MIVLESLEIENYRNLKKTRLRGLKDLNILIGPNNCGKSNILKTIELIKKLQRSTSTNSYREPDQCGDIVSIWNNRYDGKRIPFLMNGLEYRASKDERHLRENNFGIEYTFNDPYTTNKLSALYPNIDLFNIGENLSTFLGESNMTGSKKPLIKNHLDDIGFGFSNPLMKKITTPNKLVIKQFNESWANDIHVSLFSIEKFRESVQKSINLIEDSRLQKYKDVAITEYIRGKNLSGISQMNHLIEFLKSIVDPKIMDYKQNTLELMKDNKFITSIDEQGSGVRSLLCLAVDILSSEDGSIVLIDEPELGLNPAAKQAFLKFLLKEAKSKQIFLTTHDPAFANPIILAKNAAIFVYSPIYGGLTETPEGIKEPYEPNFVKIDLDQNIHTFGGYLPHSESLKPIHIYVEGHDDVKRLQVLLSDYFKGKEDELNKFGIYHLGGTFWKHLLYTIPNKPYISIVILDNDKLKEAEKVCQEYISKRVTSVDFIFCKNIEEIELELNDESTIPIYCLDKGCVEDLKSIEEGNLKEIVNMLTTTSNGNNGKP